MKTRNEIVRIKDTRKEITLADVLPPGIKPHELAYVRLRYPDAPPYVVAEFLIRCNQNGWTVGTNQAFLVKRRQKDDADNWRDSWVIQAGIDGFASAAEASNLILLTRPTKFDYDAEGNLVSATSFGSKFAHGAWHEVSATALWQEYVQKKSDGRPTRFWLNLGHTMLEKCAMAKLCRRCAPQRLSGVYVTEEMLQADNEEGSTIPPGTKITTLKPEFVRHQPQPVPEPAPADQSQPAHEPAPEVRPDFPSVIGLLSRPGSRTEEGTGGSQVVRYYAFLSDTNGKEIGCFYSFDPEVGQPLVSFAEDGKKVEIEYEVKQGKDGQRIFEVASIRPCEKPDWLENAEAQEVEDDFEL